MDKRELTIIVIDHLKYQPQVGEIYLIENRLGKCVQDDPDRNSEYNCELCVYKGIEHVCENMGCSECDREDELNVHFESI